MLPVNRPTVWLNFRKRLLSSAYRFFGCFVLITILTNDHQAAVPAVEPESSALIDTSRRDPVVGHMNARLHGASRTVFAFI
jgi:hypothetical protein